LLVHKTLKNSFSLSLSFSLSFSFSLTLAKTGERAINVMRRTEQGLMATHIDTAKRARRQKIEMINSRK
jgi:hypothetical protein